MDRALQMLQLQQQLNDATNGENWENGITKNGKKISWRRCIYMEAAEMIDSFSWKHWKSIDKAPDWDNMQIEVVDVWHFIMSLALQEYQRNMLGQLDELAINIADMPSYNALKEEKTSFATPEEIYSVVEDIMVIALSRKTVDLNGLMDKFFELVKMSGLDLTTLYRLYVGKNILNQFRQDNGYKEGTYIKEWDGEEDNVVMKRIWEENGDLKPEALYRFLAKAYNSLNK